MYLPRVQPSDALCGPRARVPVRLHGDGRHLDGASQPADRAARAPAARAKNRTGTRQQSAGRFRCFHLASILFAMSPRGL